ncbi:hypothetical protein EON66_11880 [archaeon]|nr:MAG: hypothetical protein EON66_11880 [archaeon]
MESRQMGAALARWCSVLPGAHTMRTMYVNTMLQIEQAAVVQARTELGVDCQLPSSTQLTSSIGEVRCSSHLDFVREVAYLTSLRELDCQFVRMAAAPCISEELQQLLLWISFHLPIAPAAVVPRAAAEAGEDVPPVPTLALQLWSPGMCLCACVLVCMPSAVTMM